MTSFRREKKYQDKKQNKTANKQGLMHERIILVYWRAQNIENVKNCAAVIFEIFNYNSKSKATEIKLAGEQTLYGFIALRLKEHEPYK